jgi:hypothetical protein
MGVVAQAKAEQGVTHKHRHPSEKNLKKKIRKSRRFNGADQPGMAELLAAKTALRRADLALARCRGVFISAGVARPRITDDFCRDRTPAAAIIMNEAQNDPAGPQKLTPALVGARTSKRSGQRHPIGHEMTASPWTPSFPGFFGLELFN